MNDNQLLNLTIQEALLQSNPIDYGDLPHIELLYQPIFTNDFLLQIAWSGNKIHWYRTTWQKARDREMLDTWLAYLKEDGDILPLKLTFHKEQGKTEKLLINDLIAEINTLSIKPTLCEDGNWGRDGEEIILKIGTTHSDISFHWYTCATPESWNSLDKLVENILLINKQLK